MKKTRSARTAKTMARRFAPYTLEMVVKQDPQPPARQYVYVYKNGPLYVVELHNNNQPTRTSLIGVYGQHWVITKAKEDKAVSEYNVTLAGGRVTRYIVLTRMARKLEKDIAIYEAQQEQIQKTANHQLHTNQHYISQVLLRRFSVNGRIQKYTLKYGKWSPSAPRSVFSQFGYNQLLAFGKYNNELDDKLKELEDTLPVTLAALDEAANAKATPFDPAIYERMCSYCAFLWQMSPFSKAVAPVNFIEQLMLDLSHGNVDFLEAMGMKDNDIAQIKQFYARGAKFIITGKNYLQLVYRLQFARQLESTHRMFKYSAKWSVARSPIELPIADMALIKYHLPDLNLIRSILPISSTSILIGEWPTGQNTKISTDTVVYGGTLEQPNAEYLREVICQSAILIVASKTRICNISALRKMPVVNFVQLQNIDAVLKAGLAPIMSEQDFLITPASTEVYVKWTHSIVKPYPKDMQSK